MLLVGPTGNSERPTPLMEEDDKVTRGSTMNRFVLAVFAVGCVWLHAIAVLADGDPAAGEKAFRKCAACHTLDGRSRTGPTLQGVIGRTAGTVDGFRYSPDVIAAGEAGVVWDPETITVFLADPNAFLAEATGHDSARTRKRNRYPDEQLRLDIAAFLGSRD